MTYSGATMFRLNNDRTWHSPVNAEGLLALYADNELYPDGIASDTGLFTNEFIKYAWESDPPEDHLTAAGLVLIYTHWDGRNFEPGGGNHHVLRSDTFSVLNPTVGELVFSEQRFSGAFSVLYEEIPVGDERDLFIEAFEAIRVVCNPYEALAWHRLGWDLSSEEFVTSHITAEAIDAILQLIENGVSFDHAASAVAAGARTPDDLLSVIEHDLDSELIRRVLR